MNTQTTVSFSPTYYLRHWTLSWLLFLLLSATGLAADLTFTPNAPIVEQGKQITLSVSGSSGEVTWTVAKGQIQGTGTQVTYVAPAQVGLDIVSVLDSEGHTGVVKIVITPPNNFLLENASGEIFTNRSMINALSLSEDGKTLWVGTEGGLEKRDAQTGEIQQVLTKLDGLPSNKVQALFNDDQGGLWIGTAEDFYKDGSGTLVNGGLVHYSAKGQWQVFTQENSGLPFNWISAIESDSQGGLWVGTHEGLAHYNTQGQWQIFTKENSALPDNNVTALISDGHGGLWIGTWARIIHYSIPDRWQEFDTTNGPSFDHTIGWVNVFLNDGHGGLWVGTSEGLAHCDAQGGWQVFNTGNSGLPSNNVTSLHIDSQGGLWVGITEEWDSDSKKDIGGGLTYYNAQNQWLVFNEENSDLPDNYVTAIFSDGQGGLWVGSQKEGLSHYTGQNRFQVFQSGLPSNDIMTLQHDNRGGLWIGTVDGLVHYTAQDQWQVFKTNNSGLPGPGNVVYAILPDSQGGVWAGTSHGLAHYAQEQWQVFQKENSDLPNNWVSHIISDGQDGLWIGTRGGLAHYSDQGQWQVFDPDNSDLPDKQVTALQSDSQGGLWVGTYYGDLTYYSTQGQWRVFNPDNSGLPKNMGVTALQIDTQGGLWIGTDEAGIAHYTAQGQWQVFDTKNSGLPSNRVGALLISEGLWVGTNEGLAHYNLQGQWQVFNIKNSSLPSNQVGELLSDNQGGLWIGAGTSGAGGLAHLTFTQKTTLCQTTDTTTCEKLQGTKRAAILIAGGGADSSNTLWDTTEAITNYLYKVFNKRGFDNDEIYYLSPKSWADFNGDGIDDRIVDAPKPERPLTPEDVRLALDWAKGRGKLDQPLYLFFVDHGGTEKFQLSKLEYLEVTTLKTWLDDYQTVTGNQVVMVIDACHSGQLLDSLKAPNRAIISSTSAGLAYFDRTDKRGFSRFLAAGLLKGMNFWEAFGYAVGEQNKLNVSKMEPASTGKTQEIGQVPRFYDGSDAGKWLKQLYLNGSFAAGDVTLAVESLTSSTTLPAGAPLLLQAKAVLAAGQLERVWAVIKPPKLNLVMDSNGTPILAMPRLSLGASKTAKDVWEATWTEAVYNGDYQVTFYAKDNQGNSASSDLPVVITVTGGVEPPPQAMVQPELDKAQYHRGETVTATVTEELSWGYDLYAALVLPDGKSFRAIKNTNELGAVDELVMVDNQLNALKNPNPTPWRGLRRQHSPLKVLELPLSDEWALGTYCFYGILSPERGNVFESMAKGLGMLVGKCFEVVP